MVKLYCPKCCDVYTPKSSRHHHIDGVYFGTGFPHMLFMVHPELRPSKPTNQFVPRYIYTHITKGDHINQSVNYDITLLLSALSRVQVVWLQDSSSCLHHPATSGYQESLGGIKTTFTKTALQVTKLMSTNSSNTVYTLYTNLMQLIIVLHFLFVLIVFGQFTLIKLTSLCINEHFYNYDIALYYH